MPRTTLISTIVALLLCVTASVGADDDANLPERHWPVGFHLPGEMGGRQQPDRGDVLVWTPPEAERISSVLLVPNNTDSIHFSEHTPVREVAKRHEMGIVYFRHLNTGIEHRTEEPTEPDRVQRVLNMVAEKTGIEEFAHAPWVTFGKSSRGEFPFRMAWLFPERTIAGITYHGETPTWRPLNWARLDGESILYVVVNGQTEWGGTWNRHVRPALLNYRSRQNWLAHQVVVRGVDHGNYQDSPYRSDHWGEPIPDKGTRIGIWDYLGRQDLADASKGWYTPQPDRVTRIDVWDYLAIFLDHALKARVPEGAYPTDGPIGLKQIDDSDGWLVDKFGIERMLDLRRYRLVEDDGLYVVDPAGDEHQGGYAEVPPASGFRPPEGVPVVPLETGRGPGRWLATEPVPAAIEDDPMTEHGDFPELRPRPGTEIELNGHRTSFSPLDQGYVDRRGAIALRDRLQQSDELTLLTYAVLEVDEDRHVKLDAPYTQNGRVQVFLNGRPVMHEQILSLQEGHYPMLVVLQLRTMWGNLGVSFAEAGEQEIEQGKKLQAERDELAEQKLPRQADEQAEEAPILQRASEVEDKAERADRFWIGSDELAEAWRKIHRLPEKDAD